MSKKRFHRSAVAAAGAVTAALLLAACGGDDDSAEHAGHGGDTTAPEHNEADVSFAQGMIPHHQQAVEMADLARERAGSEEVRALAEQIRAAQDPEIETLTGWLEEWGEEVPGAGMDHSGHGSGEAGEGHEMAGMMSEAEMAELANASGAAFDTAFLEMMVEHHRGAVEMAEAERADGAYEPALDMAEDITTSQTAEIDQMNQLLDEG
ncbi:DUF305 domain-containing protein [Streptomyces litchfieldiae]|uniref:DUF305 domain-containing protein n=1 Tax=Streptomyces litchfieldiae TaxID=3075543 RepID=A0ABU2MV55_9ACTN|nr:DUF305 domain-containing protein [Streptomyces sp. DSM 44938]MDT0344424.1 DUF305 domain-containing protein [Streptomyces sp. DSM 44938]